MFRQIVRLSKQVEVNGRNSIAMAVYGDSTDSVMPAQDRGFEGVACIDDTARALSLLCDIWEQTEDPEALELAQGMLQFVLAMQTENGLFVNFVKDWNGTLNLTGPTSRPEVNSFWQARAVESLSKAWAVLSDKGAREALSISWELLKPSYKVESDVRSIHVLSGLNMWHKPIDEDLPVVLTKWCEELMSCSINGVLMNATGEQGVPHLWGHIQEGVLATAGTLLNRSDFVEAAKQSAEVVFFEVIDSGFDSAVTMPYDVASAIFCMDRLYEATREPVYAEKARLARAWFDGRNSANEPVYDRARGRFADGIDHGLLNGHSGAESNIVGAQSLLGDPTVHLEESIGRSANLIDITNREIAAKNSSLSYM